MPLSRVSKHKSAESQKRRAHHRQHTIAFASDETQYAYTLQHCHTSLLIGRWGGAALRLCCFRSFTDCATAVPSIQCAPHALPATIAPRAHAVAGRELPSAQPLANRFRHHQPLLSLPLPPAGGRPRISLIMRSAAMAFRSRPCKLQAVRPVTTWGLCCCTRWCAAVSLRIMYASHNSPRAWCASGALMIDTPAILAAQVFGSVSHLGPWSSCCGCSCCSCQ